MILILGGIRSGKSKFAVSIAKKYKNVVFIATCIPKDEEMKRKIEMHKKNRPSHWQTIENNLDLINVLTNVRKKTDCVLIDCITLYISYLIETCEDEIINKIEKIANILSNSRYESIIISNEVGEGIIPTNKIARKFIDILGETNQILAKYSNKIYKMVAGVPIKIK
jgi:adenosylcobinamide kinase/adenosylcobinamide-phosphate guanylyltransferase